MTKRIAFVGARAFADCKLLHQVVLPISVKEIDKIISIGTVDLSLHRAMYTELKKEYGKSKRPSKYLIFDDTRLSRIVVLG